MEKRIVIIGGSPCSGKSTVVERISKELGAYYFKVDEALDKYIDMAARAGRPVCQKVQKMSPEETWMRDPQVQCDEEFSIYREVSDFIHKDLLSCESDFIITEAAAYLPMLMKEWKIDANDYLALVPTREFQIPMYRKREWVPYILEGCSDKEKAFSNWMERDVLFAKRVKDEAVQNGYYCIVNDGTISYDEMFKLVCKHMRIGLSI